MVVKLITGLIVIKCVDLGPRIRIKMKSPMSAAGISLLHGRQGFPWPRGRNKRHRWRPERGEKIEVALPQRRRPVDWGEGNMRVHSSFCRAGAGVLPHLYSSRLPFGGLVRGDTSHSHHLFQMRGNPTPDTSRTCISTHHFSSTRKWRLLYLNFRHFA